MIDDARRLFHEAILLAFYPVEMVVCAHVLGHGVVDVLNTHGGDDYSFLLYAFFFLPSAIDGVRDMKEV